MIRHTPGLVAADIQVAGIQNFAFGGVNTNIILKKFQ